MQEPISIKIDVTKIDKAALYKGEKGTYLTLVVWPNRDGEDDYGNYAGVKQDLGKDRRDEKAPFIGNAKIIRRKSAAPAPRQPAAKSLRDEINDADEIPF